MLKMLGSFGRCNLKIGKLGMLRMNVETLLGMNVGMNVGNVRKECYEC